MVTESELGRVLEDALRDGYEVVAQLGEGSFGRVFRARQRSTGQNVAIKVLRVREGDAQPGESSALQRFRRELQVCAELSHPHIVRLVDSGAASDGTLYAVFEEIPGVTLKEVIAVEGALTLRETLHLMSQVLDALSCAHARGIVHRDLTPANVMLSKTGVRRNAFVLDFGLGVVARATPGEASPRITATHELVGTPCYASPEQLRGEPPSPRSDLYSWGLVTLECLTGDIAMRGATAHEVIFKQLGPEPVPIPRWLQCHPLGRILDGVLSKSPDRREHDVERLLGRLAAVEAGDLVEASLRTAGAADGDRVRRQVTIVCCRVTIGAIDDRELELDDVDEMLRAQHAALTERARESGAVIGPAFADRVFVVFGNPAREDDGRRAARFAADLVREAAAESARYESLGFRVELRAGIHTGIVMSHGDGTAPLGRPSELRGPTPQVASHLVERASAGEILTSADTQALIRGDFRCEPAGECILSEFSRPLRMFRVVPAPPGEAAATTSSPAASPHVGREHELRQLLDAWEGVQRGRSAKVLVTGEAGIGKSRLLAELRRHVGRDAWLELTCEPESQTTALQPVVAALRALDTPLDELLERCGLDAAAHRPLLADLIGLRPDESLRGLSAERRKELTLASILALVLGSAAQRPTVLVLENSHWADPTTLELVRQLGFELSAAGVGRDALEPRMLLVVTTRPEAEPPRLGDDVAFLPLKRLDREQVIEVVRTNLGEPDVPDALVERVVERADGVPLFVEELTRAVHDVRARGGHRLGATRSQAASLIPATLRDLLTARLDRVSSRARSTAQLAAVLGRDFDYDVLRVVSPLDEALLAEDVGELACAGLLLPRRGAKAGRVQVGPGRGAQSYVFRHALLRDAAYDTLPRAMRQDLHRRIARSMRERLPDVTQRRPEILAHHFRHGGELRLAADHWLAAGWQSYRRADFAEAASQLAAGLEAVSCSTPSPELRRCEVELLAAQGTVLLSTRGWAVPETEATFARALQLCEELGIEPPFMALYGSWAGRITRSDPAGVEALLPTIHAMAERSEPLLAHFGRSCLGTAAYWRGDFPEAARHLSAALELYRQDEQHGAYDGGLYTFAFQFSTLFHLGLVDEARALRDRAMAIAEQRRDPYSVSVVLAFSAMLEHDCGDVAAARARGEELMALTEEQRLFGWWGPGALAVGAALVAEGRDEKGIELLRAGLERYRAIGAMCSYSFYLTYLAEALLRSGQTGEAGAVVDEGLGLCRRLLSRFHEPELLRLRGEVLLRAGDASGAETSLREAVALAEREGSCALALRAAVPLARLLAGRGRAEDAVALLAPRAARLRTSAPTRDLLLAAAVLRDPSAAAGAEAPPATER